MSYVSRNELRNAFLDCIKKKRRTKNTTDFEVNEDILLDQLYHELNTMTYTIGKSIVFTLQKEDGNAYREVFAADFKDRVVHHLLVNRLLPVMEKTDLITDNYACRKNKGTLYGGKRCQEQLNECLANTKHRENVIIMKSDFQNFFNTLNKDLIYARLEWFINKYMSNDPNKDFNLWLGKMIIHHSPQENGKYIRKGGKKSWKGLPAHKSLFNCDKNHGIAVGNLTSQIFANFYLSEVDHFIKDTLGIKYYGRYVDDFYIITDRTDLDYIYKSISNFVNNKLDLCLNENKFYKQYYEHGINFVGQFIGPAKFQVRNSTKHKFYNLAYRYNQDLINKSQLSPLLELKYVETLIPSWNSYIGIFKNHMGHNIVKKVFNKYPIIKSYLQDDMKVIQFDSDGFMRLTINAKLLKKFNILFGTTFIKNLPNIITDLDEYCKVMQRKYKK